jgi:hypothetical protein
MRISLTLHGIARLQLEYIIGRIFRGPTSVGVAIDTVALVSGWRYGAFCRDI